MQERIARAKQLLQENKQDYRTGKKALKKHYKADREVLRANLKSLRAAAKGSTEHKPASTPTGQNRLSYQVDSITLACCAPFEARADAIRYKRRDPEGFEADQLVDSFTDIVEHFERRAKKGKQLKPRHVEALTKIQFLVNEITEEKKGVLYPEAHELSERVGSLLHGPQQQTSEEQAAHQLVGGIERIINSLKPQLSHT